MARPKRWSEGGGFEACAAAETAFREAIVAAADARALALAPTAAELDAASRVAHSVYCEAVAAALADLRAAVAPAHAAHRVALAAARRAYDEAVAAAMTVYGASLDAIDDSLAEPW